MENNNFTDRMLEVKINGARNKLISNMESLKRTLEYEISQLEENPNHKPNSLGVIQYSGVEIDVLCGKLGSLYEMKEVIESQNNK